MVQSQASPREKNLVVGEVIFRGDKCWISPLKRELRADWHETKTLKGETLYSPLNTQTEVFSYTIRWANAFSGEWVPPIEGLETLHSKGELVSVVTPDGILRSHCVLETISHEVQLDHRGEPLKCELRLSFKRSILKS